MKFPSPEKFMRNIVPDLRDHLPQVTTPLLEQRVAAEKSPTPVLERLLPESQRRELLEATQALQIDARYLARTMVGTVQEGTRHPHDFVIERSPKRLSLYFVDPEHNVHRTNKLRPAIANLAAMQIDVADPARTEIAILRFRTAAIVDKTILKLAPQLEAAMSLTETDALPAFLRGLEQEISFRLAITQRGMLVQSRYASRNDLGQFLDGQPGSLAIEGKIDAHRAIVERFLRLLRERNFARVLEKN